MRSPQMASKTKIKD